MSHRGASDFLSGATTTIATESCGATASPDIMCASRSARNSGLGRSMACVNLRSIDAFSSIRSRAVRSCAPACAFADCSQAFLGDRLGAGFVKHFLLNRRRIDRRQRRIA